VCVLDLGEQALTGVFPRSRDQEVTVGPVRLMKCDARSGCGLLQLEHTYDLAEMYGDNYGYRSGLNGSMVRHVGAKVQRIVDLVSLQPGDVVLDIGSNDATSLRAYPQELGLTLVGMDPSAGKFRHYYPEHVTLIEDFFSRQSLHARFPDAAPRVVTSFAMFYDLESPMEFMQQVHEILAEGGIWVFEQSYMPTMLEANAYDTVCQEHLEFYAMAQIQWMAERVGFRIVDVEFNDINGGSFSVTAQKSDTPGDIAPAVSQILEREQQLGLATLAPYEAFAERVADSREALRGFLTEAKSEGKTVAALGASTKGNVVLQYCGITEQDVFAVGEVNDDKFGAFTPGTLLPIVSEHDLLKQKPDYLLVLPWHFRTFFVSNPGLDGVTLVFPLPELDVVTVQA
jgi:NDP-4-keto-2,6-dideoxyhexose 3-C-methyltransferase